MSSQAAISKKVISTIYADSCMGAKGKTCWDGSIFIKNLGRFVLDQFEGIRLIGEIEQNEGWETYKSLRDVLHKAFSGSFVDPRHICQDSTRATRAVLSLYIVWTGMFCYGKESGNDLWPAVMSGLGFKDGENQSSFFGRLFKQCLKENKLEEFVNIGGLTYITPILLHGLIPQKHINRFIEDLLGMELQSHVGLYATGAHLVNKWKYNRNIRYFPKPVECFIKYGYPINAHMVERFLDMAKRWKEEDPSFWRQWGLPKYMVDAFRAFVKGGQGSIAKKSWTAVTERPYLFFDLRQSDTPVLHIPAQKTRKILGFYLEWRDPRGGGHKQAIHMNFTPIGGVLQTNTQDLDVGPTLDSWKLTTTDRDKKPSDRHTVEAHLPGSDSGEKVPLFVFSRTTGKLVDMSRRNPLQEELLLVYPKDSAVEIQGGYLASEPESLTGLWFEWQFALCVIEESGTFCYRGLGADFGKNILEKIQFVFNRLEDRPVLGGAGQAPPWLRCLEEYPIFTDTKDIAITYPGWSYTIWRRAFVKLTRRNQDGFIKQLDLEPSSDGQMYAASINFPKNWGPGVYELSLRGPLGYDDIVLPFVYLPLKKLEQAFEPGTGLAYEFRFTNAKGISMEPLNSTVIRNLGQMTFLSSTDDDRALLGVKTFVQSSCPVILLFARSNLRWSRRSERGLFLWEEWRCKPEEIPVQKVEEIVDALVAVQLDGTGEIFNRGDKLKLLLKTPLEEGGEERTLFSYDAFTLRRNIHDTWVFNLRKFAEMVKSLRSVETATITVYSPDDRRELLLFTMRKHPIFKDFKVETTCRAGMGERLKISWKPQKNDPQTHRVIHIYPIDEPRGVKVNKIVDGALPPFEMELSPVQRPGLWCLKPVVQHSRFSTSCTVTGTGPSFRWFRAPQNWSDWLEWPELRPADIYEKVGHLQKVKKKTIQRSLIWTSFLNSFHYERGDCALSMMRSLLGDGNLLKMLPYAQDNVWEVKSITGRCFSLRVTDTFLEKIPIASLLSDSRPAEWFKIPGKIVLELRLLDSHRYLGEAGTIWHLECGEEDTEPFLHSANHGQLDLNYWLEDAITPDKTGCLKALFPLTALWDTPPNLPVLRKTRVKDFLLTDAGHYSLSQGYEEPNREPQKGLATLADLLESGVRDNPAGSHFCDGGQKAEAGRLLKRWQNWAKRTDINPLLARIVKGRLDRFGMNGLSGATAIIARLHCLDDASESCTRGANAESKEVLDNIYRDTLEFVRRNQQASFLRDLIISEIIVSWYWNQSLAELRQGLLRNNFLKP